MENIHALNIKKEYSVKSVHEISVDVNGWNYLIIYGEHVNGWFVAVPNWNICAEIGKPEDVHYNEEKIISALKSADIGRIVAKAIYEHWKSKNA